MLYYNSDKEIQKLKQKLMSKSNESKSDVSAARQAVNERIGKVFEKNIRYILETRHYFKKIPHVDKIFMKKIKIYHSGQNFDEYEILLSEEIEVKIRGKNYKVLYDTKHNVLIKDLKNNEISKITSENANKRTDIIINKIKCEIFPYTEMEFDGYFSMNNFQVNLFDENEVGIIYSNINKDEEKNYTNFIIEVKLNPKKANTLRDQIRKDHHYLSKNGIKNAAVL